MGDILLQERAESATYNKCEIDKVPGIFHLKFFPYNLKLPELKKFKYNLLY